MTKKIGWNVLKWSVFGAGLTSILFSLLLVYAPGAGAFGGSHAVCTGSADVYCSGFKCDAKDNVGCSCKNEDGTPGEKHDCKKPHEDVEIGIEEGGS